MTTIDRPRALPERVRDRLASAIGDGTYQPGDRIVETRVARELGVSQTVVREALRELCALRLVETVPNRGAVVRRATSREVIEAHELRAVLEGYAARRAVERDLDVDTLAGHVDAMRRSAEAGDHDAYAAASAAFHRCIVSAADHQLLIQTWETLLVTTRLTFDAVGGTLDLTTAAASHEPILDALRAGDADRAEHLSRTHAAQFRPDAP